MSIKVILKNHAKNLSFLLAAVAVVIFILLSLCMLLNLSYCDAKQLSLDCSNQEQDLVTKVICNSDDLMSIDQGLYYIYNIVLEIAENPQQLRQEQLEWVEDREPEEAVLLAAYQKRINKLLSNDMYFAAVSQKFMQQYDASMEEANKNNDHGYNGTNSEKIVTVIMGSLLESYLYKHGHILVKYDEYAPERYVRNESNLFKLANNRYLMLFCHNIYAYNIEYSMWLIKFLDGEFTAHNLKIPAYDPKAKSISLFDSIDVSQFAVSIENEHIWTKVKGFGYGGYSTSKWFSLEQDRLILLEQLGTRDKMNSNYELDGSARDWFTEYKCAMMNNVQCTFLGGGGPLVCSN